MTNKLSDETAREFIKQYECLMYVTTYLKMLLDESEDDVREWASGYVNTLNKAKAELEG